MAGLAGEGGRSLICITLPLTVRLWVEEFVVCGLCERCGADEWMGGGGVRGRACGDTWAIML